ncbi:hypothetical protein J2782_004006 [Brucella pseudogrignonensis]|uniref:Uncharacterized protein n=1 Tax=Brucella pseudogrignonensis TaxID=419475 RepID=A0ABU1MEN0_9HYPH|nr:hypothetical protein [Brucella pseudogrignonensis]
MRHADQGLPLVPGCAVVTTMFCEMMIVIFTILQRTAYCLPTRKRAFLFAYSVGDFYLNKAVSTVTALSLIAGLFFLGWWLEISFTNDMGKWMMSWVQ